MIQANGVTSDYHYNSMSRADKLVHFIDADGDHTFDPGETLYDSFSYAFNLDGSKQSVTETSAVSPTETRTTTIAWVYDNLNRLTRETYDGYDASGESLGYRDTFTLDRVGNRSMLLHEIRDPWTFDSYQFVDYLFHESTESRYDANDRLLSESFGRYERGYIEPINSRSLYTAYSYGQDGQSSGITQQQTFQEIWTYTFDGDEVGYERTRQPEPQSTTTFTYDPRGRMSSSSVTTPGTPGSGSTASTTITTNYAYDPTGIRVQQTVKQAGQLDEVHDYLIDTNNPTGYQQVLEEKVNELLKKTFTLAQDVIAQHNAGTPGTPATNEDGSPWTPSMGSPANPAVPASGAQTLTLLYDTHGSTRAVLSLAAEVIQRYSYSAYGQSLGFQVATAATSLLYSGEWTNGASQGNLQYLRDRWMMPGVGRFTQMDKLSRVAGDNPLGWNLYLYADANGANFIDPTGLATLKELLVTSAITTTISTLFDVGKYRRGEIGLQQIAVNAGISLAAGVIGGHLVGGAAPYAGRFLSQAVSRIIPLFSRLKYMPAASAALGKALVSPMGTIVIASTGEAMVNTVAAYLQAKNENKTLSKSELTAIFAISLFISGGVRYNENGLVEGASQMGKEIVKNTEGVYQNLWNHAIDQSLKTGRFPYDDTVQWNLLTGEALQTFLVKTATSTPAVKGAIEAMQELFERLGEGVVTD
jgi:RHS repeat-associated protein